MAAGRKTRAHRYEFQVGVAVRHIRDRFSDSEECASIEQIKWVVKCLLRLLAWYVIEDAREHARLETALSCKGEQAYDTHPLIVQAREERLGGQDCHCRCGLVNIPTLFHRSRAGGKLEFFRGPRVYSSDLP
ncbi:hypothetical protein [Sphingomonas sp. ID0503]|uniref:hypothetical protein n=1 Tax=Sphingomonas sp. ID0503 TaxID=3399691 RepID=UPI003AFA7D05